MFWPFYPAAQYLLVDAKRIVIEKWRKTGQHFVDQNTKRPPVNRFIVSFALNYFWRQIFWCAAQSPRSVRQFLRKSEIGDLQVSLAVQQKILRFQIPVNYVFAVQVFQRANNFGRVEAAGGPGKSASCP